MTAGWVAATMRGRALLRRATGVAGARAIAGAPSWEDAREQLARTVVGRELAGDADRAAARAAASAAMVWQLRVLAGWVPPTATALVRVAAAPVEIADIEEHVAALEAGTRRLHPPVTLGSLSTAWPRVAMATSPDAVRDTLRRSVWGDPGGTDPVSLAVGLRVAWLRRVRLTVPDARPWANGALGVVVARERFGFGREIASATARDVDRALGRAWRAAATLPELVDRLGASARWPLVGIDRSADLWRAEQAVLRRVTVEATARAASERGDRTTVAAILALFLVDLYRVHAAIALAGHGAAGREAFDAVAA